MKMMKSAVLCLALCAAVAPDAQAQMTWTDKGFVNVTGGAQTGSHDLATSTTFDIYDEKGSVSSSQDVKGGGLFDISAGYKVWRNLAAGVGFSHSGSKADTTLNVSVPDPRFFDAPRAVTASASGLKHSENVIHLMGTWMVPVTDKVDVGISFGPSIFMVKQDLPTAVTIAEPGPTVTGTTIASADKTSAGVNFGIDVTYLVTKKIGVGGLARFTRGSADLEGASDKLTVGGFQIGVGVRYRF